MKESTKINVDSTSKSNLPKTEATENPVHFSANELSNSDRQFRLLVNSIRDYAIFILDLKGFIQSWNLGAQLIKGYTAEEVIGQHFSKFYTKEDLDRGHPQAELELALSQGRFEEEGWRVRKDGNRFWANVVITALQNEEGRLIGFSKVTRDLTERKLAEEKLLHSYEHLMNSIPLLVWTADPMGLLVSANRRWHEYTGLTEEQMTGSGAAFILHPDENEHFMQHYRRALSSEQEFSFEHRMRRFDGQYRWFLTLATPSRNSEGQIWAWFGTSTDIHEQKMVAEELQQSKLQAEQANQAKSAFLANMSHEIRTPLGAILGFAELMGDEDQPVAERFECIATIKRNGVVLSKVINEILDLSKIESQKMELEFSRFSLVDLIQDVRVLLDLQAQEKGLGLVVNFDSRLPGHIISDPTRLRQILFNIVGNAVKFTEKGEVVVDVQTVTQGADSASAVIRFEVTDSGPGIDEQHASRIFEPFIQADNSMTRKHGGTGLGLSIARRLAQALGGDLRLSHSQLGVGSTFEFTVTVQIEAHETNS